MTAPDVAAIARGLGHYERRMMLTRGGIDPDTAVYGGIGATSKLARKQLIVAQGMRWGYLTPLGLAVRAYLQENPYA